MDLSSIKKYFDLELMTITGVKTFEESERERLKWNEKEPIVSVDYQFEPLEIKTYLIKRKSMDFR